MQSEGVTIYDNLELVSGQTGNLSSTIDLNNGNSAGLSYAVGYFINSVGEADIVDIQPQDSPAFTIAGLDGSSTPATTLGINGASTMVCR